MADYDVNPNVAYLTETIDYMLGRVLPTPPRPEASVLDTILAHHPHRHDSLGLPPHSNTPAKQREGDAGAPKPHLLAPMPFSDPKVRAMIYKATNNHPHPAVDLGGGNFRKGAEGFVLAGRYRGPPRVVLDIENPGNLQEFGVLKAGVPSQDRELVTHKSFDFNAPDLAFLHSYMEENPGTLITSTNALMHAPDLHEYKKHDMVYSLPSPEILHQQGNVVAVGERVYKFVGAPGVVEYDHSEQLDHPEGELQGMAINLAPRVLKLKKLKMTDFMLTQHLTIQLTRKPIRITDLPKGSLRKPFFKKIDGITMVMRRTGTRLYIKTPISFDAYHVTGGEDLPLSDFEVEGEFIEGASVMVLHTVYTLGGIRVPTFMKKIEAEFVSKQVFEGLPFVMYSKKAYDTVDHCLVDVETFGDYKVTMAEGVVCTWLGGRAPVAAKVFETLELTLEDANELVGAVYDLYGIRVRFFPMHEGVTQYLIYRDGDDLVLKADCVRQDKHISNSRVRCLRMIARIVEGENHSLQDYMDMEVLVRYGVLNRNLGN